MKVEKKKWRLNGQITLDVYVSVVADTLEEAIEIAEDNVDVCEYCGAQVGVDVGWADEVDNEDLVNSGYGIEWNETWCELEDTWLEEEDDEEDDDEDEEE